MVAKLLGDIRSSWNATKQCHKTFKFGDGHKVIAMPQVIMLAQSGNKKC